jgi:hypothetical protein
VRNQAIGVDGNGLMTATRSTATWFLKLFIGSQINLARNSNNFTGFQILKLTGAWISITSAGDALSSPKHKRALAQD